MSNNLKRYVLGYLFLCSSFALAEQPLDISNAEITFDYTETWKTATIEQVEAWLETSPDLEGKDRDGKTVLFWAAAYSTPDVVRTLIGAGADVTARDTFLRSTVLMNANTATIPVLLEAGADINAQNDAGMTALMIAAPDLNMVTQFLAARADTNILNTSGETALMFSLGNSATMLALIVAGADVNARDNEGRTALFRIIEYQIEDTVLQESLGVTNEILEQANVEVPEGFTEPANPESSISVLLEAGANVDTPDNNGNTPLMLALSNDNKNLVKILLEAGAQVNLQNEEGNTALMIAASRHQSFIAQLLEAGSQVNLQDREGKTALMIAASQDKLGPVRELLEAGADISLEDANKKKALDYANGNVYWLLFFRTYRYALLGTVAGLIALGAFWFYHQKRIKLLEP